MWRLVLIWMMLAGAALGQSLPRVTALGVARDGLGVAVAVRLSGPLASAPRALPLESPWRWAVDLPAIADARLNAAGAGDVSAARAAQFDPRTVRVVVETARPMMLLGARVEAGTLVFTFAPTTEAAFRTRAGRGRVALPGVAETAVASVAEPQRDTLAGIAELLRAAPAARPAAPTPPLTPPAPKIVARKDPPKTPPAAKDVPPPATVTPEVAAAAVDDVPVLRVPRRRDGQKPLLVIDPGHGGRDVGAIATTGGYEKAVTLAVARAVKRAAEADGRVRVRLTRDDDRFLTLNQRVALARRWGADLFVSVHADSAPNAQARGASVYTLSEVASDAQAARLAAKENNADAVAGVNLRGQDRETAGLLIELAQRDSMNSSVDFAAALQRGLAPRGVRFRSQFLHFAGFRVLKNVGVPAVLLETGYLSNDEDAAFLFSDAGRRALGRGIADAALAYLTGGSPAQSSGVTVAP